VPGWRVGWIIIYDTLNVLEEVRDSLFKVSTKTMGANTLIQAAIPDIFEKTPKTFYTNLNEILGIKNIKIRTSFLLFI
jgi:tyrosine aminotransferase